MSVIESSAFSLTEEQVAIREAIDSLCTPFDNDYWRELDAKHEYPEKFVDALYDSGWMSMLIPEEFGVSGIPFKAITDTLVGAIIKRLASGKRHGVAVIAEGVVEGINPGDLEGLEGDVTPEVLKEAGLVGTLSRPVKVLGEGEIGKALNVSAHAFSASARQKIEAAGGTATVVGKAPV